MKLDEIISDIGTNQKHLVETSYCNSDKLEVRIRTHQLYSEFKGDFFSWVLDNHTWQGNELVLDVGCGSGRYIPAVSLRARDYVAGDLSFGMVSGIDQVAQPVKRINLDAQSLPYADNTADVILANHMIYHIPDREKAAHEFKRVLKPGGTLLAATNSGKNRSELLALRQAGLKKLELDIDLSLGQIAEAWFSMENGAKLLGKAFQHVELNELNDAFLFPEAQPVIDYINSSKDWLELAFPPEVTWQDYESALREILAAHFDNHPVFRVSKVSGVFVCS